MIRGKVTLRLDDAHQPRLELKWSRAQRKFNLEKTANQYLNGIQKTYRKQIGKIEIRRDRRLIPKSGKYAAFYENKEALFFSMERADTGRSAPSCAANIAVAPS